MNTVAGCVTVPASIHPHYTASHAASTSLPTRTPVCEKDYGFNWKGPSSRDDVSNSPCSSAAECSSRCSSAALCEYWVLKDRKCYLKKNFRSRQEDREAISGWRCPYYLGTNSGLCPASGRIPTQTECWAANRALPAEVTKCEGCTDHSTGPHECWSPCDQTAGYCSACDGTLGTRGACCKRGSSSDPAECQSLPESLFRSSGFHECVLVPGETEAPFAGGFPEDQLTVSNCSIPTGCSVREGQGVSFNSCPLGGNGRPNQYPICRKLMLQGGILEGGDMWAPIVADHGTKEWVQIGTGSRSAVCDTLSSLHNVEAGCDWCNSERAGSYKGTYACCTGDSAGSRRGI